MWHTRNAADHAIGMALTRDFSPGMPNLVDGRREPRTNSSVVTTSLSIRLAYVGLAERLEKSDDHPTKHTG